MMTIRTGIASGRRREEETTRADRNPRNRPTRSQTERKKEVLSWVLFLSLIVMPICHPGATNKAHFSPTRFPRIREPWLRPRRLAAA
jgi:hypothetical protein